MRTSQNRRYQSETALNSPTSIVISFVINLFTIFQASTSAAQSKRQGQGEKEIVSLGLEERVGEDDGIHAAVRETAETTDRTLATSKGTKHRGTGFNPEWLNMLQFKPWLYHTQHGMFCRLCRHHKPAPKKGATKRAFVEFGANTYRQDYLERHITKEHHQESIRCQASLASGVSVMDSFEPTIVLEHEAVIGGFKCLYWLVKNEKAHHTNYSKLLSLAELLGCDYFKKLKIDHRNNYRSHRIIDEMLEILSHEIEEPILMAIRASQAISLEIDESTDVSVSRQLDLHVRYMDKEGKVVNQFLDLVTVPDGKADTIVSAVKKVLLEKGIPTERLYGLGTDGAAVMTGNYFKPCESILAVESLNIVTKCCFLNLGRLNGVAKQLTDSFPKLVTVACAAHRLALACKDASNDVKYMATFRNHLQDLYLYFRNSANRTATLKAASITLGVSDLKLKEVKDTRWLSQHKAIETLQRNLSAVLGALAEEAEVRKCPGAKGLYTFCATYRFVAAVYLQADVLPHLACLSKIFQKAHVNFLHIKEQVPVTIQTLKNINEAGQTPLPGSFLSRLHEDLDDPQGLGAFNIQHEEERDRRGREVQDESRVGKWARFQREIIHPYITGLVKNLEKRFHNLDILGAFHVLGPQSATLKDDTVNIAHLQTLSRKCCPQHEKEVVQEWLSFKNHVLTGIFKNKNQEELLSLLASEFDEWANLYPCLSLLASIALVIPVSSVNCERDFSTMNRVKTDLRNQLQREHLAACLRISINGPSPEAFPYNRALETFFSKPRKIRCSNKSCRLCYKK
ncbi:zinc finger protein 862-like isoform X3 [Hypomesus transpacificus]|uniref:zinc finger protein 862-like isoform X3 n=1 Tax=Hypomesus transpacificus TaxID=137520 RepID=UPI001F072A30|nr:zinc finger protein 862-like isoform X3 [Hypomesus transpacificus]